MENMRRVRKSQGLTLEGLEALTDIAANTLSRYERGEINPTSATVSKIASALGISVDELLNGPAKNELTIQFVWEVENMNPIAMTPNVFSVGYQGDQYLFWGSLPQNLSPDEIAERIKRELIAAAAGLKARNKSLAKQSGE